MDRLEAGYEQVAVLQGVSLEAGAGEIVAVIGPNGAGKSTLLKAVYGLARVRGGTVRYNGADVTGSRAHVLTELGLNFVPQTDNVFPSLSVAENLAVAVGVLPRTERRLHSRACTSSSPCWASGGASVPARSRAGSASSSGSPARSSRGRACSCSTSRRRASRRGRWTRCLPSSPRSVSSGSRS